MNPPDPDINQPVRAALHTGEKIEAIKLYREINGNIGLAEAKAAVEALEEKLRKTEPHLFVAAPKAKGCVGVLACLAGTLVVLIWWLKN